MSLLPICLFTRSKIAFDGKTFVTYGCMAGVALFAGATLQQVGLQTTSAGTAGFITGIYLVFVPLIGFCLRQRIGWWVVSGVTFATVGLYLLSVNESFHVEKGDLLVLVGAMFWAIHVQIVGKASKDVDPLRLAVFQYAVCAVLNLVLALVLERTTGTNLLDAWGSIAYAGLVSVGIAYTLQIVAQRHVNPSHAAIILSLEAVFAVLGGWWLLNERLAGRELLGCGLMLAGMAVSQLGTGTLRSTDVS